MKRNGKIELMRFLFSVSVVVFHINLVLWNGGGYIHDMLRFIKEGSPLYSLTLSKHGNISVEFFFLVSGWLMAASVSRRNQKGLSTDWEELSGETVRFFWRKVKSLLPYHLPFCGLMIWIFLRLKPGNWENIIRRLPSLLFFNRVGIMGKAACLIGEEWYISSMLIALFLLYPLCRRYGKFFNRVIAPWGGLMILGFMCMTAEKLSNGALWDGLTYHCNLRAIAEISLGCTCYEVSMELQKKSLNLLQRALVSAAEIGCYLVTFAFIVSDWNIAYESYILMCLCVAVTLSFSGQGLFSNTILFQNPLWMVLGAASLPIYLIQAFYQHFVPMVWGEEPLWMQTRLMLVLTVLTGLVAYGVVTGISAVMKKGQKS